ncbi:MAG: MscL family protein [Asgard group archaeon]|nr:MscL family protein [Asgard group archaeon]
MEPKEEEPEKVEEPPKKLKRIKKFGFDFLEFIRKYRVFGLAVAFIMATYVGLLVASLVSDIIMPIFFYIPGLNQLEQLSDWTAGNFLIGNFLATLITFIIISIVIFLLVKLATKIGLEKED